MKKVSIIALVFGNIFATMAQSEGRTLTADDIRARLEVKGEIYTTDDTGKRLQMVSGQVSNWRSSGTGPIESNWGSRANFGEALLHHVWTVKPDGTIAVLIEEFANEERDPKSPNYRKFFDVLKKTEFTLENFAPVTWKVLNAKSKNTFVRLTPSLRESSELREIGDLPIAGRNVIVSDNQGHLWTEETAFDGIFVGMTTYHGTIAISFKPFKNATEIGSCHENLIRLAFPGGLNVKLHSETAFLPVSVNAKVYGLFISEKKTACLRCTHTFDSNTEEKFQQSLALVASGGK